MSQEQLSEKDAALFERVYVPAFVKRCAARGLAIPDEDSLKGALETTAFVLEHLQSKQGDVIKSANESIKKALGVVEKQAALNEQQERLAAAFQLGQDPVVREAILNAASAAA